MKNNRIVILTPIPFWHPGTLELINKLKENNLAVCSLDIWSLKFYDEKGNYRNLYPSILNGFLLKLYIRFSRKRIIQKIIRKSDIVDIQWCGHYYADYMEVIKENSHKVIATLFGSDFYRNTLEEKQIQSKIFEYADKVVIGPNMKEDFMKYFPLFESKIEFGQYGSARLDIIDELNTENANREIRQKYDVSLDKLITTVGYNAKSEQQHILFLDLLMQLSEEEKSKIILLLPLTYGGKEEYKQLLREKLDTLNIDYLWIDRSLTTGEKWLTDIELAEIRIMSDITVNIQTTDALSSSVKEALLAGDVVITGKWLPYEIYEDIDAFIIRCEKEKLVETYRDVIKNYSTYQMRTSQNKSIMLNFASWKKLTSEFINRYLN
ncbi:MAG TPA: hypothetical protein PLP27_03230 [Crocinitomicaceae bacterium]|nr:hypothetical protein [Crocinitomicaceae bacterium]